ncbi:hypothetical protein BJ138DRAFT_1107053 [Hygrophoropsis aurantiaca]|uniref:Uncharacterized protein n=2 Tax=Hygrophoropsis aurantiaca TaxID=72124 RepID=A0ACB7ZSU7_9AGAM|nr:hypothetical protein BJ138DRAFT_1107053 [Hygrophoropsis aurantiaca]
MYRSSSSSASTRSTESSSQASRSGSIPSPPPTPPPRSPTASRPSLTVAKPQAHASPTSPKHASPPRRRPLPQTLRLHPLGIDPAELIGKRLRRLGVSGRHPVLTLEVGGGDEAGTGEGEVREVYQVRVDGYDPVHRGIPKALEMDPALHALLHTHSPSLPHANATSCLVNRTIADCALITLTDKAFSTRADKAFSTLTDKAFSTRADKAFSARADKAFSTLTDTQEREHTWDQNHTAFVVRFADHNGRGPWHSVWATLTEHEHEHDGHGAGGHGAGAHGEGEHGEGEHGEGGHGEGAHDAGEHADGRETRTGRGRCVFRSYDDVYVERLSGAQESPKGKKPTWGSPAKPTWGSPTKPTWNTPTEGTWSTPTEGTWNTPTEGTWSTPTKGTWGSPTKERRRTQPTWGSPAKAPGSNSNSGSSQGSPVREMRPAWGSPTKHTRGLVAGQTQSSPTKRFQTQGLPTKQAQTQGPPTKQAQQAGGPPAKHPPRQGSSTKQTQTQTQGPPTKQTQTQTQTQGPPTKRRTQDPFRFLPDRV